MEVNLGDRIWLHVGPATLIVGYLVEQSPDGTYIAISPVPFDEYKKLALMQRASIPVNWLKLEYTSYVSHVPYAELLAYDEKINTKPVGFGGVGNFLPSAPPA